VKLNGQSRDNEQFTASTRSSKYAVCLEARNFGGRGSIPATRSPDLVHNEEAYLSRLKHSSRTSTARGRGTWILSEGTRKMKQFRNIYSGEISGSLWSGHSSCLGAMPQRAGDLSQRNWPATRLRKITTFRAHPSGSMTLSSCGSLAFRRKTEPRPEEILRFGFGGRIVCSRAPALISGGPAFRAEISLYDQKPNKTQHTRDKKPRIGIGSLT